jgi:uncharacterized protein YhfF
MNRCIFIISLFVLSCGQKENREQKGIKEEKSGAVVSEKVKVESFNDIDATRTKLSAVGIGDLGQWRDDEMGGFVSITNYYTFGKNNLNNLAFYLESDNPAYVTTLKLVLNINNKGEKGQALIKLAKVTEQTFNALNLELASELKNSIQKEKPLVIDSENFVSELKLEKSKIDTWIVKITAKK